MASADFTGLDAIKARLQALLDASEGALKAAGASLLKSAQDSIIQGGTDWPEWSAAYARHVARTRAHQMLWDYGTLLRSLTVDASNNVFKVEGNTLTLGSSVKYAAAQNFGYEPRNLPARSYLFVDEDRLDLARKAFIAQLARSLE